jgi:hypothetical protein
MATACKVCRSEHRARIEMLRVGGASLRSLSERFGLHRDAIWRHCQLHVTPERRASLLAGPAKVEQLANKAADESTSLLDHLRIVRSVLLNQFLNAAEAGDRTGTALLSGRLLESLREVARLTGELREVAGISVTNNVVNLFASPEFTALQEGLLKVARAHPAARADIIALLRGLGARSGAPQLSGAPPLIEGEALHVA